MGKKYLFLGWLLTILIAIVWTYENPEKIKNIKDKAKFQLVKHKFEDLQKKKIEIYLTQIILH